MPNQITSGFYSLLDYDKFFEHMQGCLNNIPPDGIYLGDNLFTFSRNLGFLNDKKFVNAASANISTLPEQAAAWRYALLCWAARHCLRIPGDFVECACYRGTTARIICDYIDFRQTDKNYYLYDLFEHDTAMPHHGLAAHGNSLFQEVAERFSDTPNVRVTKGRVPEILQEVAPEKIAFLHLDLNNADAEIGALEILFDRMSPGGILILDDFGWLAYADQQSREVPWFAERGYLAIELPTGQGLLIK